MQETSCHPTSIPQEIWLSPYFHTSILGHGLSPYFQGPGCHPTSVGLFLFSLLAGAIIGLTQGSSVTIDAVTGSIHPIADASILAGIWMAEHLGFCVST